MGESKATELYQEKLDGLLEYVEKELKTGKQITEAKINGIKYRITEAFLLIAKLCGKIETLESELGKERTNSARISTQQPTTSYAGITKGNTNFGRKLVNNQNNSNTTVIITPKEGEDTRAIEKVIRDTLNPRTDKIKIKKIKTTKKNIIIETESNNDTEKIIKHDKLQQKMTIERPKKKMPKIIVYDVPNHMTTKDLTEYTYEQNFEELCSREEFEKEFQPKFKTGPRDKEIVHHVVEVSPRVRNVVIQKGRIYLPFISVTAKDFLVIPRCNKCQDLGHVAKHCLCENTICAHCGDKDHERKECTKRERAQVCIACNKRGKKCNKTGKDWRDCETYRLLVQREIDRTDYGQH